MEMEMEIARDREQADPLELHEDTESDVEEQTAFFFESHYPYLDSVVQAWLQAHAGATLDLRLCFEGSDGFPAHHRISAALGSSAPSPLVMTFIDARHLGSQANLCACVLKARLVMEAITDVQVVTKDDEWSSLLPVMKAWESQLKEIEPQDAPVEDEAMDAGSLEDSVEDQEEDDEEENKDTDNSTLWLPRQKGFPLSRQTAGAANFLLFCRTAIWRTTLPMWSHSFTGNRGGLTGRSTCWKS
jgi:hypothetical protein